MASANNSAVAHLTAGQRPVGVLFGEDLGVLEDFVEKRGILTENGAAEGGNLRSRHDHRHDSRFEIARYVVSCQIL